MIADYERSNFSVSQAIFEESYTQDVVAITAPDNTTSSPASASNTGGLTSSTSHGLPTGAIAGIAAGIIVLALLLFLGIWFCLRRRKRRRQPFAAREIHEAASEQKHELAQRDKKHELIGGHDHKYGHTGELDGGDIKHEVADNSIVEADGSSRRPEMDGDSPETQRSELLRSGVADEMQRPGVFHHRGIYELAGAV